MDPSLRNKTAIVGVGYTPIVRKAERSLGSFALEAALAAIEDAGLTRDDIDGYVGTPNAPNASASHRDGVDEVSTRHVVSALGLKAPRFMSDLSSLCMSGLVTAAMALNAGLCNYVLILRAMYNPVGVRYAQTDHSQVGGPEQFITPYGIHPIGRHAQWLRRYMHDYGATREELFAVVKANRSHAQLNPYAYWRGRELGLEEYMSSRWIYDPMCIYDCDIPVTAAGAAVVTTAERAKALRPNPAYITGFCNNSQSGDTIFQVSGVDRRDVQTAEIYDGFVQMVWYWLELLGFCERGEAHEFTKDGRIELGGELPVNTFGGSQGEGRLHGFGHIREAAMQVMGRAGERQVANAQHVVATNGFEWIPGWVVMFSADAEA
jgi:acetyl-CoA acetyltransferase